MIMDSAVCSLALDRPLTAEQRSELRHTVKPRGDQRRQGLGNLSAPLQAIVDFLEIDEDLIAVAAGASPPARPAEPPRHSGLPSLTGACHRPTSAL